MKRTNDFYYKIIPLSFIYFILRDIIKNKGKNDQNGKISSKKEFSMKTYDCFNFFKIF